MKLSANTLNAALAPHLQPLMLRWQRCSAREQRLLAFAARALWLLLLALAVWQPLAGWAEQSANRRARLERESDQIATLLNQAKSWQSLPARPARSSSQLQTLLLTDAASLPDLNSAAWQWSAAGSHAIKLTAEVEFDAWLAWAGQASTRYGLNLATLKAQRTTPGRAKIEALFGSEVEL